ncbi:MAG: effector binding domain-containing protein [Oscillospiraceae bacterium]
MPEQAISGSVMTISEVSRVYAVTPRMLRYYEQEGLLRSLRKADYAYRVYDETAVRRLGQIIVLRKLRIPLKSIAVILNDAAQQKTLELLRTSTAELDGEISALTVIRDILVSLTQRLDESVRRKIRLDLLEDTDLKTLTGSLTLSKSTLKEERSMEKLNQAEQTLGGKGEARIVYIPPATVAASRCVGTEPEGAARAALDAFIRAANLTEIKPDFRVFGFNNPTPQEGQSVYGYEFWVTIPDDADVPAPLEKKQFSGGQYAAHCIQMGNFHEWEGFFRAMETHPLYEIDWHEPSGMGGALEEHLNAFTFFKENLPDYTQLDLLIPVKKRIAQG